MPTTAPRRRLPTPPATPTPPSDPDTLTFNQRVRRAIGQAVARLADLVEPILQADKTPFLIGPTDCRQDLGHPPGRRAPRLGLRGARRACRSFADADLVGLKTDHWSLRLGVSPGPSGERAAGRCVLLFLDELTRLNQRAHGRPDAAAAADPARSGLGAARARRRRPGRAHGRGARCGASTGRRSAAASWRWPATPGVRRSIRPWCGAPCRSKSASIRPWPRSSRSRPATPSRRRGSW